MRSIAFIMIGGKLLQGFVDSFFLFLFLLIEQIISCCYENETLEERRYYSPSFPFPHPYHLCNVSNVICRFSSFFTDTIPHKL